MIGVFHLLFIFSSHPIPSRVATIGLGIRILFHRDGHVRWMIGPLVACLSGELLRRCRALIHRKEVGLLAIRCSKLLQSALWSVMFDQKECRQFQSSVQSCSPKNMYEDVKNGGPWTRTIDDVWPFVLLNHPFCGCSFIKTPNTGKSV